MSVYILEHGYRWLTGDPKHAQFWNPNFFYPKTNVGAYTDILVGAAPFYGFWRLLGAPADTAFQFWMLTVVSLNFLAAYLWLRRGLKPLVNFVPLPCSAGAFLFAYGSARIVQTGHQQLLPHFYTIIALYALTRLFGPQPQRGSTLRPSGWVLVFFASLTLQLYAGFYLGWFLLTGLEIGAIWALIFPEPRKRLLQLIRGHWGIIAASVATSAAILAPMVLHYLEAGREVGYRRFDQEISMVPRLQSWFYLGPGSWIYFWQDQLNLFRNLPMKHEHQIGMGLLTTAIAVAGLFSFWKNRWVPFIALCATTLFVMVTFFPGEFTPWRYLHPFIPAAKAIRALSRVGLLMLIPAALGVALFLQKRKAVWTAVPVAFLCAVEQGQTTAHYDKLKTRAQIESIVQQIGPNCESFYLSPMLTPGQGTPEWKFQVDAMWAQMQSGIPTVNGYSGNFPPGWWGLFDNGIAHPDDESRIRHELDRWAEKNRNAGMEGSRICWIRMPLGD